eukprot:COSAG01_NODE_9454_length_2443_cov_1.701365_3_plen_124_part_00
MLSNPGFKHFAEFSSHSSRLPSYLFLPLTKLSLLASLLLQQLAIVRWCCVHEQNGTHVHLFRGLLRRLAPGLTLIAVRSACPRATIRMAFHLLICTLAAVSVATKLLEERLNASSHILGMWMV